LKDGIWYEFEKIASTNNSWECIHCQKTFRCPQADQLRKHIDVNCDVTRRNRNKELVSDLTILSEVSVPSSAGGITSGISKRLLQPSVKTFFAGTSDIQKKIDEMFTPTITISFSSGCHRWSGSRSRERR
jgi:hypothetical protein